MHRWSAATSQPDQIEPISIKATADGDSLCGAKNIQGQTVYFAGSPDRLIDFLPWGVNSIGDGVGVIKREPLGALQCEDGRFTFPDASLHGINTRRDIVGSIGGGNVSSPGAALWLWDWEKTEPVRYPLNRWIPLSNPAAQWPIFNYATKINNSGMILALGFPPGGDYERPYLLLPVETITINTFIPHEWVDDPRNNPLQRDTIFEGDNRNAGTPPRATWNENGSHRTQHRFNIVAWRVADADGLQDNAYADDPDGVQNDNQLRDIGTTRKYDKATSLNAGNITAAARADTVLGDSNLMTGQATASENEIWIEPGWPKWLGDKKIEVKCRCEAVNPLVSGAPAISYTFVITIDKTDPANPKYSLTGDHDGFPAYEIYINHQRIHHYDPMATGEGLGSLGPPAEKSVSQINQPLP